MDELVHHWQHQGRTVTFAWVGDADVTPSRVYALAFTADGDMLLVNDAPGDAGCWLPGGGIESGESPEEALVRELLEEAAATVHAMRPLGSQRVDDPATGSEFHTFYWCQVTLADEYAPKHEVTERQLVRPDCFLDTLFWGPPIPKPPYSSTERSRSSAGSAWCQPGPQPMGGSPQRRMPGGRVACAHRRHYHRPHDAAVQRSPSMGSRCPTSHHRRHARRSRPCAPDRADGGRVQRRRLPGPHAHRPTVPGGLASPTISISPASRTGRTGAAGAARPANLTLTFPRKPDACPPPSR